jgi:hypothetical protein
MILEELIDFLRENLRITLKDSYDYYGTYSTTINLELLVDDKWQTISSEYFTHK